MLQANILEWLQELGLGNYADTFAENGIDFAALPLLREQDLIELGVLLGHRRVLLAAIRKLPDPQNQRAAPSASMAGRAGEDGERRQITALFADISGFTNLTSRSDAEEIHELLNRYFAVVDSIVQSYGGTIDKHIGDEVMAVFGAPVAHGNDPERALRAALDIHEAVGRMEPPLKVHIGVAAGQVVASSMGSPAHSEYTVVGDSVNLASRLTSMAGSGQTLVSASVQRALGDRFNGVDLGEQGIDGLLEPVTVWRLDDISPTHTVDTPGFVGRNQELSQFSSALDRCLKTGRGETIVIRGDAGIGKTRLLKELASLATERGFADHSGLVLDFGTGGGKDAIRALVRSLLSLPPNSSEAARADAATRCVSSGWLDESQLACLNDLLDLPQPPDLNALYEAMDNDTRNRGKQDVVADLVRSLSKSESLLLQVEDLHWADGIILAHLAHLSRTIADFSVVLILTTRIGGDPLDQAWHAKTSGAPLTTIELDPLEPSEAHDLAQGFGQSDPKVIETCVERCGGNPLFLVQLLSNADELGSGKIPGTIQGIVQSRLDLLSTNDRTAVQAAAVLGQLFSSQALESLIGETEYDPANLIDSALIQPSGPDLHFAHALIRDAAYASMLGPRRIDLHRKAANWFRERDHILYAEHLDRAGEPGAAEAYLTAAKHETEAHRYERAVGLIERGLELNSSPETEFNLTCAYGDLLRNLGQADKSIAAFERTLKIAAGDEQICRGNIGMAEALRIKSQYRQGLQHLAAAEKAIGSTGSGHLRSRVHHLKGNFYFPLGEIGNCLGEQTKALHWGRESGSAEDQARAYGGLADANYQRGRMVSAGQLYKQSVAMAEEHNLPSIAAGNYSMLGTTQSFTLEFENGLASFREGLKRSSAIGNFRSEMLARAAVTYILIAQGSIDEALETGQSAYAMAMEYGVPAFAASSLRHQSWAHLEAGNREQANDMAERAWELVVEKHMERFVGPFCLGLIARASTSAERRSWAIEEGSRILAAGSVSHNHLCFHRDIMELGLQLGDPALTKKACDAMADYTREEPLPWSEFHIARAEALSDLHQGVDQSDALNTLKKLKDQAEAVGFRIVLPRIEAALSETAG